MGQVLRKVLKTQEIFAHDFWELFNSLGFRIDQGAEDMSRIRDRLWKLEHPQGRERATEETGLFVDDQGAAGHGSGKGDGHPQAQGLPEGELGAGGNPGANGPRRIDIVSGAEMTAIGRRLLRRARERFGEISPCSGRNWEGCVVDMGKYGIALYCNTPDGNTHMILEREQALEGGLQSVS